MTGKEVLSYAHGDVNAESLAFSPDGNWLASGGSDGTFQLRDLGTGREHFQHAGTGIVTSVAFRPDSKQLAWCSCREAIMLWDFAGIPKALKLDDNLSTDCLAFSYDGSRLAACGGVFRNLPGQLNKTIIDGHLNIWETNTAKELLAVSLDGTPAASVSFSPDGSWLALSTRRSVVSWEIATATRKELLKVRPPQVIKRVTFGPGRMAMAASVEPDKLRVWDATKGHELYAVEWRTSDFSCVDFAPNGELLASDYKAVKVWDSLTSREVLSLETGEDEDVCSVALSPDGRYLATGYVHGEVKVWNLAY
jgi:WD40 repeat protein